VPRLGPLNEISDKYHTGEAVATPSPEEIRQAIQTIFENYPYYLDGIRKYREDANWGMAARNYVKYLES
jgi:hypothetical protein